MARIYTHKIVAIHDCDSFADYKKLIGKKIDISHMKESKNEIGYLCGNCDINGEREYFFYAVKVEAL